MIGDAAVAPSKARFGHSIDRQADLTAVEHIANVPVLQRTLYRLLHGAFHAPKKPLPIFQTFTARI
jgi:hypothetical protein